MKIAAVALVKDEADIIELFVRVNSEWASHIFILDNGSSDATPHILRRLAEEGYPLTVHSDPGLHYHQSRMTNGLIAEALKVGGFDFVFPIDADEFVEDPQRFKAALATAPKDHVAALEWMTLVPNASTAMADRAPLLGGFSRRRTEMRRVCKVVLPVELARTCTVGMGNHGASRRDGSEVPQVLLDVRLAHVPVRSKEQIITKTIVGSHKMSIKEGRKKDEVFHWDLIAEFARGYGFRLSDENLRDIALGYGWSRGDPKVRETEPVSIGHAGHTVRYAELANVNLAQTLDGFIGRLCEEIRVQRSTAGLAKRVLRKLAHR